MFAGKWEERRVGTKRSILASVVAGQAALVLVLASHDAKQDEAAKKRDVTGEAVVDEMNRCP